MPPVGFEPTISAGEDYLNPLFYYLRRQSPTFTTFSVDYDSPKWLSLLSQPPHPSIHQNAQFLGSFAKFRKATVSFVMSVRPFVRLEQLGSHWADFHEI